MHTLQQLYSGELKGAKHLKLSCGLTQFPDEIFLLAESLEILDLSVNKLSSLPKNFGSLSQLKIIFLSDNLFTSLPEVLSDCPQLEMIGFKSNQIEKVPDRSIPATTRWLILTNNKIKTLPSSIGNCKRLQKLALAGNKLQELPIEMAQCKNLELLRISANNFLQLPEWLFDLPKLAWLAFAGNSFNNKKRAITELPEISWNEFEILEQLGEGASGNIYKANWKNNLRHANVAIKVFKGEVTSDGFPEDEMQVSIAAGEHINLVKLLGKTKDHPQNKMGLIMALIPKTFYNLGLPPDLKTCSRDTFPETTFFTARQILIIAKHIASVAGHLHAIKINHGDLYAHNILMDETTNCLMGDFGAASFYETTDAHAKKIQQIEVRAFGCLLDDLLMRIKETEKDLGLTNALTDLKNKLMHENVGSRPVFADIITALDQIE